MDKLGHLLENVRILPMTDKRGVGYIISQYEGEVVFKYKVSSIKGLCYIRDAEYCSPNAVADILTNTLQLEVTSEDIVKISNWVE